MNNIYKSLNIAEHIPSIEPVKEHVMKNLELNYDREDFYFPLAHVISYDPALTLEFLKIANSDVYGFGGKIYSIEDALRVIDKDLIKLIIEQYPVLPRQKIYSEEIKTNYNKIIKHSIEVRIICEILYDSIFAEHENLLLQRKELLTAAILHDIGFMIILFIEPDKFIEYLNSVSSLNKLKNIKTKTSIPNHSITGALICKQWNLPKNIISSISFHHEPQLLQNNDNIISKIIYIADNISQMFYEIYFDHDDIFTSEEHIVFNQKLETLLNEFNISMEKVADIRSQAFEKCNKLFAEFKI